MKCLVVLFAALVRVANGQIEIDLRIIGGQDASVGEFPYQASLRYDDHPYCGGSIVDETTILTAAHCVYGKNVSKIAVAVGNNHLSGGEIHKADYYIKHEKYDPDLVINDIALIKLKDPLDYNDRIQPVALGTQHIPSGVKGVATGWGFTVAPVFSEYLQKVNLITFDLERCRELNAKKSQLPVRSTNLCTIPVVGEGTCKGDSGGPLVSHKYQIGIVSWSYGCAGNMPDVYTRISKYANWIEEHKY